MTDVLGDTAPAENERTSSGVLPSPLHSTFRPVKNSDVVYPAFGRHSGGITLFVSLRDSDESALLCAFTSISKNFVVFMVLKMV